METNYNTAQSLANEPRNKTLTIKVGQTTYEFYEEAKNIHPMALLKAVEFAVWLAGRGLTIDDCKQVVETQHKLQATLDFVIEIAQPHCKFNLAGEALDYYATL